MLRRSPGIFFPSPSSFIRRTTTASSSTSFVKCSSIFSSSFQQQTNKVESFRFVNNNATTEQEQQQKEEQPSLTAKACPFTGKNATPNDSCPMETPKPTDFYSVMNQLGKSKLSGFVTSTATAGYVLCGGTSFTAGFLVTLGTYLQSLSANTANQCIEIEHDREMKRTMYRPLVTGVISRPAAAALSATQLAVGTAILTMSLNYSTGAASLFALSNPIGQTVAALGVINWILYVCMYTPLKRVSATNTWFGAIVGAIPPLMGGVAASNLTLNSSASLVTNATALLLEPTLAPAYLLAVIMFAWQIPHFMSLSFHCRRDYENAGYKMLAFEHPTRAAGYAVLLSSIMAVFCVPCVHWFMPVEPWYYVLATVANGTMIFKSVRFYNDPKKYCRSCFVFSYIFLSAMLVMLCLNHMQPVYRLQNALGWNNKKEEQEQQEGAVLSS